MKTLPAAGHSWLILVIAGAVLGIAAECVSAQTSPGVKVGIGGGGVLPTGEGDVSWGKGYLVLGTLGINSQSPFGVRLEGSYSRSDSTAEPPRITRATREFTTALAEATLSQHSGSVQPYGLAGIGLFVVNVRADAYDPFGQIPPYVINVTETAFAVSLGAGLSFPLGARPALFTEVRYTHAFTSSKNPVIENGTGSIQLVGGITF